MQNYNDYIQEIIKLDIRVIEVYHDEGYIYLPREINIEKHPDLTFQKIKIWDLSKYNQHDSNYDSQLISLQQAAITDILNLPIEQIKLQLTRAKEIGKRFSRFYKKFRELKIYEYYNTTNYSALDVKCNFFGFFNVTNAGIPEHTLSPNFLHDLQDAVMFKQSNIKGFVSQLEKILGIEELSEESFISSAGELKTNNDESEAEGGLKLSTIFTEVSKYNKIMNILVNRNYCQSNTYIWKDYGAGYKGLIAALLKYLHIQGYYIKNRSPKNEEIIEIMQNTFGVEVKIDHVKRAKPENYDLSFIPPASTL